MAIKIKSQKDVLATEFSIELPANLNEVDQLMRAAKSTGTIVATYNQGGMLGINVKQNTRVPQNISEDVRELIGIKTREMD